LSLRLHLMLLDSSDSSQPLLRSRSPETVFAVDDDDYESTGVVHKNTDNQSSPHTVRFHDTTQVIAPSLRSTLSSREIGVCVCPVTPDFMSCIEDSQHNVEFEQDSDDLDDETLRQLEHTTPPRSRRNGERSMPLLVGLVDSSASRRSFGSSTRLSSSNRHVVIGEDVPDLDEIAAKRTAGGGMFDSIANMANSILGAGKFRHNSYVNFFVTLNIL